MTTIPLCPVYLKCVLALRRPLPFSTGGLRRMDGRTDKNHQTIAVTLRLCFAARVDNSIRPLFDFVGTMNVEDAIRQHSVYIICTLDNLKDQLQIATELEFITLSLYLTDLYTIVHDCNVEAYELIRTIVMQEMLNYAQVVNILISIGDQV